MKEKEGWNLFFRYFTLLIFGMGNLKIFYLIFTPLTVYPVLWLLKLLDANTSLLEGNLLFFEGIYAQIISACVAGAAYYLMLILNLSTPMKKEQRIASVLFLFITFLVINILRIFVFVLLAVSGFYYFDLVHKFVWYFGSTVMLVAIWFVNVWKFKINSIPIYNDFREIFRDMTKRK
ncbi:pacearchaeosortase [Candidatus Pacearchaeota archaeon]|nr:pacearchaeosortase [Candidatus Pacearchaeota archaeon]